MNCMKRIEQNSFDLKKKKTGNIKSKWSKFFNKNFVRIDDKETKTQANVVYKKITLNINIQKY